VYYVFIRIGFINTEMITKMENNKNKNKVALYKDLKQIREQILYWEKYQGVNWLGKWARSVRLERLHKRHQTIERKLQKLKNKENDNK